jgi:hypothetical protein
MFLGSRAKLVYMTDNLTAICLANVVPQHVTTLEASAACYKDSSTYNDLNFTEVSTSCPLLTLPMLGLQVLYKKKLEIW